jgi:uncharacterized protein (DUF4213/DUF364 family)
MPSSIYEALVTSAVERADSCSVIDCAVGKHCALVRTEREVGLAAVLDDEVRGEILRRRPDEIEATFRGRPLAELIPLYLDDDPLVTVMALAAINSLFIDQGEDGSLDWNLWLRGKKRLGMVGLFWPIMERVAQTGVEVIIFELQDLPGTHRQEEAAELLPSCDAVLITGATLGNRSLHHYMPYISPEADAYIGGHSTPLADPLLKTFTLGGTRVLDADYVARKIRAGGKRKDKDMKPYLQKIIRRKEPKTV